MTDVLRLLLSSPQFSTFLNEMNGPDTPRQASTASQIQPKLPQQQEHRPPTVQRPQVHPEVTEDIKSSVGSPDVQMQQPTPQAGMVIVPSQQVDGLPPVDMSNGWNSGIDINFVGDYPAAT